VEWAGVGIRPLQIQSGISKFDMTLVLAEGEHGLAGTLEYNRDLYERESMERLLGHYQRVLSGLVERVDQPVWALQWLSEAERDEIVQQSRGEAKEWSGRDVVEMFEAQVRRVGKATAVISEGEQISYEELNQRANQLAHYLREMGVGPEVKVGLLLRRSVTMVVGVLGVLKAGAAYLPLEVNAPLSRLAYMLEDAQVPLLLTEELPEGAPAHWGQTIYLDSDWEQISRHSEANPAVSVSADNLAYMIYTSGSSGRPKGALITRGGLSNYLNWALSTYPVEAGSGSAVHTPLSFDLTVTSLFTPLLSGKTVHLLREAAGAEALVEALQSGANYSLVKLTPSHLEVLRQQLTAEQAGLCSQALVIGGEALYEEQVRWWREQAQTVRLYNEYGPTETVVGCCVSEVGSESKGGVVSIGRPISNTQLYVLDERMEVMPVGLVGEIYIGGAGVSGGYWERAELTAERYLPNPFSERGGERLYRSGDTGRYQHDGQVEYVGRLDEQVKVRGYRVELGEIEAELREQGAVWEAVVMQREDQTGSKRLVAYVVAEAGAKVSVSELRQSLQERLPEYMIPAAFVVLEELPLTVNGKVDRRALPAPDSQRPEMEKKYVAPRNQREEKLAGIWSQVLGVDQVGIHDNFFELGGDSIRSIQVVARARQQGLAISTRQLFQYQSIAELASAVEEHGSGEVFGSVPLTPIQHWFFEQKLAEPQQFNQSVLLSLPQSLDAALLRELIAALLRHHDALRLRFKHSEAGWSQEIARFDADEAVPLTVLDFAHVSDEELQAAIEAEATRAQSSLDLSGGPLLRVVLFELGAGRGARLLLVIHHLAVDGVSWRILMEDLQRGYEQLAHGERVELGTKTSSYQQWAESLHEYGERAVLQMSYWEQVSQEPVSRLLLVAEDQSPGVVKQVLSEAETRELIEDVPEIYHTETQEVLLTALAETLSRWSGAQRVKVEVEGDGREETGVDVTRTVGCFTTIYPLVLETTMGASTGEHLKQIKEQVRAVPPGGIGYGVLRYLKQTLNAGADAEISFKYLGELDQVEDAFSAGEIRTRAGHRRDKVEVAACVVGGQLQVSWTFNRAQVDEAEMEQVAQSYMEDLREIIQHCADPAAGGYTLSDVVDFDWSQQDLDKIVTQISGAMVSA
jgi:amino acid adenylation domain-containing protein/non-ribosomal peptide synthase protein (TIGR01720 family)